jgi:hypothetical protein
MSLHTVGFEFTPDRDRSIVEHADLVQLSMRTIRGLIVVSTQGHFLRDDIEVERKLEMGIDAPGTLLKYLIDPRLGDNARVADEVGQIGREVARTWGDIRQFMARSSVASNTELVLPYFAQDVEQLPLSSALPSA